MSMKIDFPEGNRLQDDPINEKLKEAGRELYRQHEQAIYAAIRNFEGWDDDIVLIPEVLVKDCEMHTYHNQPFQDLYYKGIPLLRFHPIQHEAKLEGDSYKFKFFQKVEKFKHDNHVERDSTEKT